MLFQTQYKNNKINKWGCYYCCMLNLAEEVAGSDLTDASVDDSLFYLAQKEKSWNGKPAMEDDCYLNDPEVVANLALYQLGEHDKKIIQVGTDRGYFREEYKSHDFIVYKMKTKTGYHFVCEKYNPNPSVKTYGIAQEIYYKVITL